MTKEWEWELEPEGRTLILEAMKGDAKQAKALGDRYLKSTDVARAKYWYEEAVKGGNKDALFQLAILHAHGNPWTDPSYQESVAMVKAAAEEGSADALHAMYFFYRYGRRSIRDPKAVEINKDKAIESLREAVKLECVEAGMTEAKLYQEGDYLEKDIEKAHGGFLWAYYRGSAEACYALGNASWMGEGTAKDPEKAKEYFKEGAERDSDLCRVTLALALMQEKKYKEANGYLETVADKSRGVVDYIFERTDGRVRAQANAILGGNYLLGAGVPKDVSKAFFYFQRAASGGNMPAMHEMMKCLGENPTPIQARTALFWMEYAANYKFEPAVKDLPVVKEIFEQAIKTMKPEERTADALWKKSLKTKEYTPVPEEAAMYHEWAAEAGSEPALLLLAKEFEMGGYFPMDLSRAGKWYAEGVKRKYPLAQYRLACCLLDGEMNATVEEQKGMNLMVLVANQGLPPARSYVAQAMMEGRVLEKNPENAIRLARLVMMQDAKAAAMVAKDDLVKLASGEGDEASLAKEVVTLSSCGDRTVDETVMSWYDQGKYGLHQAAEALQVLERLARSGEVTSMRRLAEIFISGRGLKEPMPALGYHWYLLAAHAGDGQAALELARCFFLEIGCEQDLDYATYWATVAKKLKVTGAEELVEQIANA